MNTQEFLQLTADKPRIVVELGCGPYKKPGSIGIDSLPVKNVDIVANLEEGLPFIPDNSVDEVYSSHFLEHINHIDALLKEIHRILKPTGVHKAVVPHFSNPYYYSDFTHSIFFGLYSFDYYATDDSKLKRTVPNFYNTVKFKITKRRLVFKSQFILRQFLKRLPNFLFNINHFMQELYEECFTGMIQCSEIYFEMIPEKNG
jgi:predicted SAM-dependent methyltransferase